MRRQPRLTASVNVKLKQTDFEKLEALAASDGINPTEWARRVVLKVLNGPDPQLVAIAERIDTLRYVLFNGLPWLAPDHLVNTDESFKKPREVLLIEETFRRLILDAEARVPDKARATLKAAAR
jgi:hypothetical protein